MSRLSINRRLATLRETAARIDPMAVAVHSLPPALRLRYDNWCAENERRIAQYTERDGPGGAYAALLNGEDVLSPIPSALARALSIKPAPTLTVDSDAAAIYREMVGD